MIEREDTRIVLQAQMACKGMLVLSQTMYPGWQAMIDGRRGKIYNAYGVLPGVVIDAGQHRIEIRYRPASVYWGASLTGLGLMMALWLSGCGYFGKIPRRAAARRQARRPAPQKPV
jgi:uncharacterized membrane protein YfhO